MSSLRPTIFTPFSSLPTELRLQVWVYALPDPTYIHFSRCKTHTDRNSHTVLCRCCPTPNSVPSLLHTDSESRSVALQHFLLIGTGNSRIYFNPALDTLLLGIIFRGSSAVLAEDPEGLLGVNVKKVRHVAVYNVSYYRHWYHHRFLLNFVNSLESFAVLDLRDWEAETRIQTDNRGSGLLNYHVLRKLFDPQIFRQESLVKVDEEELRGMGQTLTCSLTLIAKVTALWRELSERPLDVKVLRLPFHGREEVWRSGMAEEKNAILAPRSGKPDDLEGKAPPQKKRGERKPWKGRLLRRLFSKKFCGR